MSNIKALDRLRELCAKWRKTSITPGRNPAADEVDAIADEIEREIAEKYMELPVDAEGVPVKLGDTIGEVDNCEFYTFTVEGYTSSLPDGEGELLLVDANDDVWNPRNCRHFKLRTIEEVLRDCCNEWNEHCGEDWESGVCAKYAEEIRGMMA